MNFNTTAFALFLSCCAATPAAQGSTAGRAATVLVATVAGSAGGYWAGKKAATPAEPAGTWRFAAITGALHALNPFATNPHVPPNNSAAGKLSRLATTIAWFNDHKLFTIALATATIATTIIGSLYLWKKYCEPRVTSGQPNASNNNA